MINLSRLPVVGLLVLAAACGGGDAADQAAPADGAAAGSGTPTVQMDSPSTAAAPAGGATVTPDAGGQVHEVKMVTIENGATGRFEPANITVKKGDVIRWTMADSQVPHNVSFSMGQNQPAGFTAPTDSPFLNQQGQTFELKIDWNPGTYNYVCMPHMTTGMVGAVTVS